MVQHEGSEMQIGDMVDDWTLGRVHDLQVGGAVVYMFANPARQGVLLSSRAMWPGHTDAEIVSRVRSTDMGLASQ